MLEREQIADEIERLKARIRALGDCNRQLDEFCNDYRKLVLDDLREFGEAACGRSATDDREAPIFLGWLEAYVEESDCE
jgi:hypothetical protein